MIGEQRVFSRFIVLTEFPNELSRWVQAAGLSPFWILMAVMALYILLGTFLDEVSTILITVPMTLPLILSIGHDGVWFGIFVTVMCTIGLISPPTGMTVLVIQAQLGSACRCASQGRLLGALRLVVSRWLWPISRMSACSL